MKLFPTIKFVDVMPTQRIEMYLTERQVLRGLFGGRRGDYIIHVLNRKGTTITLLHELGHWLIEIILRSKSDKCHKFYDKSWKILHKAIRICMKEYSLQIWEKHQVETREERCVEKFNQVTFLDIL